MNTDGGALSLTRAANLRRSIALGVALLCALGCGGVGVDGPLGVGTSNGGAPVGGSVAAAERLLVGRWLNVQFFVDGIGVLHSSETTWQFFADKAATKTLVTRNHTEGFYDVIVNTYRWSTTGDQLTIGSANGTFNQVLAYRISGDTLVLATMPFIRVF